MASSQVGLIDYGMGNLHSVSQAFIRLKRDLKIVQTPRDLYGCQALILPGVGSFDPAMENLKKTNLIPYLKDWTKENKPLLGICLGLQLLFESSEEGDSQGLGLIKGTVKRLPDNKSERIPHMGWAPLEKRKNCPLFEQSENHLWMYFVHSYSALPLDNNDLAATAPFGDSKVTAVIWKKRLGACQFHPEKSAKSGQRMLKNWVKWLDKINIAS